MQSQAFNWTCSVCAFTWSLNATAIAPDLTRDDALVSLGYPDCVNQTYGCMTSECLVSGYRQFGVDALQSWVTFEQAYALCSRYTGVINPVGMYHYMAIRGVSDGNLWVANSARGYLGVYDVLTRDQFNAFGPVQIVALIEREVAS